MQETKLILRYPVKNGDISQPFGYDNTDHPVRSDYYKLFGNKHPGVDFTLEENTSIEAAYPGIVVRRENHVGMGNTLGLRYGNIIILYAHLNSFEVNLGDIVHTGEVIGLSGNTGKATTIPHLHFEMRDISKSQLSEMVFDPPFNSHLSNQLLEFTYQVKNDNTPKTWNFLSQRYFGTDKFSKHLRDANSQIEIDNPNQVLPDGKSVLIPNYK